MSVCYWTRQRSCPEDVCAVPKRRLFRQEEVPNSIYVDPVSVRGEVLGFPVFQTNHQIRHNYFWLDKHTIDGKFIY